MEQGWFQRQYGNRLYTPDYISVEGPHVPRRISLFELDTPDRNNPEALPLEMMTSRLDIRINISRRKEAMPYIFRNVEADELHFLQSGKMRFDTEFGSLEAGPGDFICIPRSVSYRTVPHDQELVDIIMESPEPLRFDTPAPFGMVDFDNAVRRASISDQQPKQEKSEYSLILKSNDGLTRFVKPVDPLAAIAQVGGTPPVWALNLSEIQCVSYGGLGGPPAQFLSSPSTNMMLFSLSSRPSTMRPPVHHNADYDELILYVQGPGAWGAVTEPGTLSHVPKGVTHHGPSEDVPEGYLAWLLETRATMRFTPDALKETKLIETGMYGVHPLSA